MADSQTTSGTTASTTQSQGTTTTAEQAAAPANQAAAESLSSASSGATQTQTSQSTQATEQASTASTTATGTQSSTSTQANAENVASKADVNSNPNQDAEVVTFDANGYAQEGGQVYVYQFDQNTGLFLSEGYEQISAYTTVAPGATRTAPPTAPAGQVAVYDQNKNVWNLEESHIGTNVWIKATGQETQINAPGPIPSTVTTVAPTQAYSVWDDSKGAWEVNVEARSEALKLKAQAMMRAVMAAKNSNGWDPDIDPMPDDVSAYAKALLGFIKGTDTTSTALPAVPAEVQPFVSNQGS